jgi:hypothetical protein
VDFDAFEDSSQRQAALSAIADAHLLISLLAESPVARILNSSKEATWELRER